MTHSWRAGSVFAHSSTSIFQSRAYIHGHGSLRLPFSFDQHGNACKYVPQQNRSRQPHRFLAAVQQTTKQGRGRSSHGGRPLKEDKRKTNKKMPYNESTNREQTRTFPLSTDRGRNIQTQEDTDDDDDDDDDAAVYDALPSEKELLILPQPPAGFVLDKNGNVVLMAPPSKRITTIVDPSNGLSLECLIRRLFSSSDGRQCFLLCPLDTPVQILRVEGLNQVLAEISDEELQDIFPEASYELAKRRLHLVYSGYCLTMRGSFCYLEDEVMDLNAIYGDTGDESLHEGVEIVSFVTKGSQYLVYSPLDPLTFIAYRDDDTGELVIADDELLSDEAVLDAIDEEKEFQAYVDEELAMSEDDEL